MLLRFTSCALNGPPLGIQDQRQKRCFVLQYPTVCVHSFRTLFHVGSDIHVLHHTSTNGEDASLHILAIVALDSAPTLSRSDRVLSQTYLVAAPHLSA